MLNFILPNNVLFRNIKTAAVCLRGTACSGIVNCKNLTINK